MSQYHRILIGIAGIALIAQSVSALAAQAASPKVVQPSEVVHEFYRWYLQSLAQDRDPVTQDRATLKKYVAKPLIDEIERRMKSPDGLDADYFLQAQDYLDEWKSNISVSQLANNGTVATVVLTLGAKGSAAYRLKVTLRKEADSWKIAKVQSFRG